MRSPASLPPTETISSREEEDPSPQPPDLRPFQENRHLIGAQMGEGPTISALFKMVLVLKGQGLGIEPRRMPRLAALHPEGGRRARQEAGRGPAGAEPTLLGGRREPEYRTSRNDRIPRQNTHHPPPATHSWVEARPWSPRAWGLGRYALSPRRPGLTKRREAPLVSPADSGELEKGTDARLGRISAFFKWSAA